jgi:hypothetical protein
MTPEDREWLARMARIPLPGPDVTSMLDPAGGLMLSTRARLSPQAAALSRAIVGALPRDVRWFHGGRAGRAVGERLLAARDSGLPPANALGAAIPGLAPGVPWVWFSNCPEGAAGYAASVGGHVYEVEPRGEIEADPEHLAEFMESGREVSAFRSVGEVVVTRVLGPPR